MSRLIVLGIDGATFTLLEPWAKEGKLPAFGKLLEGGVYGPLESLLPPETMSAWPAILTGKDPGKLGVLEFWRVNRTSYKAELDPLLWEKWNPLWRILDRHGKKVCMCNVPTAYAPEGDFSGLFVSGPQSQGGEIRRLAYPPMLEASLKKINYQIYAPSIMAVGADRFPQLVSSLTDTKMKIASMLLDKESWDFFMFGLFYADQMGHFYWKYTDKTHPDYRQHNRYSEVILDYYRKADGWLESLFSRDANIVLVSDHGQGKMLRYANLNAWLRSKSLLVLTPAGENRLHQGDIITTMKLNGQEYYAKIRPKITTADIDWSRTKAYSVNNATININLKGREGRGCVGAGEEYDDVRGRIREEILELEDSINQQRVVEKVYFREELYEGVEVSKLPDIILAYRSDSHYYNPSPNVGYFPDREVLYDEAPEYCFELERSAHHTRQGVFAAYGPDIARGGRIEDARNVDIAPTVLHMLGVPVPGDVDGRVLKAIFREDSPLAKAGTSREKERDRVAVAVGSDEEEYTEEEKREVEGRLKGLGYL